MKRNNDTIDTLYANMVEWRRYLHKHPELSFNELKTAQFVYERLERLGLEVKKNVGGNGVAALLRGSHPGPTVALRADMDALPIQDEKNCEYASEVSGVMHACGHDAHTAVLLALAADFERMKADLHGNILFIFQHAEEVCPGGAVGMIEGGVLNGVDVIYGAHLWTPLPVGTAALCPGPMMASADEFHIEIKGRGGHGGLPHEAVDSIVVGSHLIVNMQSIVSRLTDPIEPCVISVGSLHAGSSFNVIAETCTLTGTVRTFDDTVRSLISEQIDRLAVHTCQMFGATYKIDYKRGYPPLVNDAVEAQRLFKAGASLLGPDRIRLSSPVMAAEDFSYYLREIPGCFVFVGAGNDQKGIVHPHHHPRFDIDEEAMLHAAKLLRQTALDYMEEYKCGVTA